MASDTLSDTAASESIFTARSSADVPLSFTVQERTNASADIPRWKPSVPAPCAFSSRAFCIVTGSGFMSPTGRVNKTASPSASRFAPLSSSRPPPPRQNHQTTEQSSALSSQRTPRLEIQRLSCRPISISFSLKGKQVVSNICTICLAEWKTIRRRRGFPLRHRPLGETQAGRSL